MQKEIIKISGFKTYLDAKNSSSFQTHKIIGFGYNKKDLHYYQMEVLT
mgnify:CR=1 FL=1